MSPFIPREAVVRRSISRRSDMVVQQNAVARVAPADRRDFRCPAASLGPHVLPIMSIQRSIPWQTSR